jgi:hypothetical protein
MKTQASDTLLCPKCHQPYREHIYTGIGDDWTSTCPATFEVWFNGLPMVKKVIGRTCDRCGGMLNEDLMSDGVNYHYLGRCK